MIQAIWRRRIAAGIAAFTLLISMTSAAGNAEREKVAAAPPTAVTPAGPFSGRVENSRFRLELKHFQDEDGESEAAYLVLSDKETGMVWNSSPPDAGEDPLAKNSMKTALKSLLQIRYADQDSNLSLANSAVNARRTTFLEIPDGVRVTVRFESEGITVSMDISLTEEYLKITIPVLEIDEEEDSGMKLVSVIPLPYFGALHMDEEGYMLVPDGSGALIDSSRMGNGAKTYKQYIYGRDPAIEQKTSQLVTANARLPVYGTKKGDAGVLGIIHTGASRACVNASLGGDTQSYHSLNAELIYRDFATVDVGKKTYQSIKVNLFEDKPVQEENFEIRLYPLTGEDTGYVGMARQYRDYLLENGVSPSASAGTAPLYVELFGGVKRQTSVLGIPMDRVVPITSYEDVRTIVTALQDNGVEELVVGYTAWGKGGSSSRIPLKMQHEGALGSKKDWLSLQEELASRQIALYPDLNFTDIYQGGGFSGKTDGIKTMQKNPLVEYRYKLSTYQPNPLLENTFLLTPGKVRSAADTFAASLKEVQAAGFSARTLGQKLYSDFGPESVNRMQSQRIWEEAMETLCGAAGKLLFSDPNAYAFPYAAHLTDVPADSSEFLIESRSVPFYQIALHGILPITLPALNSCSDVRQAKLKALETGCLLKYTWGAENFDSLLGTEMDGLLGLDYSRWLTEAAQAYREVRPLLQSVSGVCIRSHRQLAHEVYETVYENGVRVIVNYNEAQVDAHGETVPGMGYLILEE